MRIDDRGDLRVKYLDPDGPLISTADDASDLIGNAWVENVGLIAVPVTRLDPAFFELSSGVAGEFTQKLVNYQLRLAVIGDVSAFEAASGAFRDWVWESNRGRHVWFVPDHAALDERLAAG
jgi:hypothetical protein